MTTITITLPAKGKAKLSALVKELGGEIVSITSDKETKKEKLLNEIREGIREARDIHDGKKKGYTMADLFDGE